MLTVAKTLSVASAPTSTGRPVVSSTRLITSRVAARRFMRVRPSRDPPRRRLVAPLALSDDTSGLPPGSPAGAGARGRRNHGGVGLATMAPQEHVSQTSAPTAPPPGRHTGDAPELKASRPGARR